MLWGKLCSAVNCFFFFFLKAPFEFSFMRHLIPQLLAKNYHLGKSVVTHAHPSLWGGGRGRRISS
jgi:hypothetical protein